MTRLKRLAQALRHSTKCFADVTLCGLNDNYCLIAGSWIRNAFCSDASPYRAGDID
jgi:hypothetical protein